MTCDSPIGIFDSGIGGLSIFAEVREQLPDEDLIYLADTEFLPYGEKSPEQILQRSEQITQRLIKQDCKALIVACNTATSAAIAQLRRDYDIPIIGVEPAVKPAVTQSKSGVVGVLATSGTLKGEKFALLKNQHIGSADILVQPCPGLVELIETGNLDHPALRELITGFLAPLLEKGADTIVLGCTHYPMVKSLIAELAGPGVTVIDPSEAVARELRRRLTEANLRTSQNTTGSTCFYTSADNPNMESFIKARWNAPLTRISVPTTGT